MKWLEPFRLDVSALLHRAQCTRNCIRTIILCFYLGELSFTADTAATATTCTCTCFEYALCVCDRQQWLCSLLATTDRKVEAAWCVARLVYATIQIGVWCVQTRLYDKFLVHSKPLGFGNTKSLVRWEPQICLLWSCTVTDNWLNWPTSGPTEMHSYMESTYEHIVSSARFWDSSWCHTHAHTQTHRNFPEYLKIERWLCIQLPRHGFSINSRFWRISICNWDIVIWRVPPN